MKRQYNVIYSYSLVNIINMFKQPQSEVLYCKSDFDYISTTIAMAMVVMESITKLLP